MKNKIMTKSKMVQSQKYQCVKLELENDIELENARHKDRLNALFYKAFELGFFVGKAGGKMVKKGF